MAGREQHDSTAPLEEESTVDLLEKEHPGPKLRRSILWRSVVLVLGALGLYLLAPSVIRVFASFDELARINPLWFPLILALQAASIACMWYLQRLALRTKRWFAVATSQVAGNAFSRLVPGGNAAGVALQYRMLSESGIRTTTAASGLTAVSLLTVGVVLSLPAFSLPAILGGTPVASGLVRAAWLGVAVFVVMLIGGTILLFSHRALERIGRAVQWILNRRPLAEDIVDLPERLVAERAQIRLALQAQWWQALLAAVGRSMFDYASLLVALLAVGAEPDPALVLLAFVASQVLAMIPITPGGLGFVEAGLTATLALAGVPASLAVVATLAYRLASYWIPMAAGLVAVWMFRQRFRRTHPTRDGQARLTPEEDDVGR